MTPTDFARLTADLEAAKADYLEKDAKRTSARVRLADLTEQFELAVEEFREATGIDTPARSPAPPPRASRSAGPAGREIGAPFHAADWCRPEEFDSIKANLDAAMEEAARENKVVFGPIMYETRKQGEDGADNPPEPGMVLGVATAHVAEVLPL